MLLFDDDDGIFSRKQAKEAFGAAERADPLDIHQKLMQEYRDIPEWAYLGLLVLCSILFLVTTSITAYTLPVWATILGISLSAIMIIPQGI